MSDTFRANKNRSQNREGWCALFRHPVRQDARGGPLRVRKGLGTKDAAEADNLIAQLNRLLGDESYWSPASQERAAREMDPRVVAIFYADIVPMMFDPWEVREERLALPSKEEEYARLLILGTTGAGKTTLLRQLIGSDPRRDRFPSTAKAKTTVADMEIILADGPFTSVVAFLPQEQVRTYVEECTTAAISLAAEGVDRSRVVSALMEHAEQRFRLSYLLGTLPDQVEPDEDDDWDAEPAKGDDEGSPEVTPEERRRLEDRLQSFVASITTIGERMRADLEGAVAVSTRSLKSSDLDAFLELMEDRVRDDQAAQTLIDEIMDEIESKFALLDTGEIERDRTGWPVCWSYRERDREQAIRAINRFSSNYAPNYGRLLTPLVVGIRVKGPFTPTWATQTERPKLVLLDGEGLGHTGESTSSLPTRVTRQFPAVDVVLLVDNAEQPMLAGPAAVLRGISAAGHDSKLAVVFTHFDQMKADNLKNTRAKQEHVQRSVENALQGVESAVGSAAARGLRRHLQDRLFFVGNIQENLSSDPPGAKATRAQLNRLLQVAADSIKPSEPLAYTPVYDTANLVLCIAAAVDEFHRHWSGVLGVTYVPGSRPEHWTRIKALSRRFAEQGHQDEYDSMKPVADLYTRLTERMANFIATPRRWLPSEPPEEVQQAVTERIRRAVAARMQALATRRVRTEALMRWRQAYDRTGRGSGLARSQDLWAIYRTAAPPIRDIPTHDSTQFLDLLRALFLQAVVEAGGEVAQ